MVFRGVSVLMALFFLMSAVVQFNDPDWPLWVMVYGAILIATALTIFYQHLHVRLFLIILILVYGAGVFHWSASFKDTSLDAFMAIGMKNEIDEKLRELWGLVICFIWATVLMINHLLFVKKTS